MFFLIFQASLFLIIPYFAHWIVIDWEMLYKRFEELIFDEYKFIALKL